MLDAAINTVGATQPWVTLVGESILTTWSEQAFFWPKDRPDGMEALLKRRPDMDARVRVVTTLIATVGSRVAKPGVLSDEEYDRLILRPLHAALPFLYATIRKELARNLVALHLTSS